MTNVKKIKSMRLIEQDSAATARAWTWTEEICGLLKENLNRTAILYKKRDKVSA